MNIKYNFKKHLALKYNYDTHSITIIENENGKTYSRWNKINRKFVISDKDTYRKARLNALNNRFNGDLNDVRMRTLKKSLRILKQYALPGEIVSFKCNINNQDQIKGRLSKVK